jgi:hypothetical protein
MIFENAKKMTGISPPTHQIRSYFFLIISPLLASEKVLCDLRENLSVPLW